MLQMPEDIFQVPEGSSVSFTNFIASSLEMTQICDGIFFKPQKQSFLILLFI